METVKTKTLRFTTSWIIDHGDPEPLSFPVKDMIDVVSDLQTALDFGEKLLSEEGVSIIDWILMILSLIF